MEVNPLLKKYIPLVNDIPLPTSKPNNLSDTSLLVSSPEEIERNLKAWRDLNERLHIIV